MATGIGKNRTCCFLTKEDNTTKSYQVEIDKLPLEFAIECIRESRKILHDNREERELIKSFNQAMTDKGSGNSTETDTELFENEYYELLKEKAAEQNLDARLVLDQVWDRY
ncbi:MAG: hypothetical protein WDZ28_05810 [Simkaniaceae bacterium]